MKLSKSYEVRPMTRESAKKVNATLMQLMTKTMETMDQMRRNMPILVILIQTHENGMNYEHVVYF